MVDAPPSRCERRCELTCGLMRSSRYGSVHDLALVAPRPLLASVPQVRFAVSRLGVILVVPDVEGALARFTKAEEPALGGFALLRDFRIHAPAHAVNLLGAAGPELLAPSAKFFGRERHTPLEILRLRGESFGDLVGCVRHGATHRLDALTELARRRT